MSKNESKTQECGTNVEPTGTVTPGDPAPSPTNRRNSAKGEKSTNRVKSMQMLVGVDLIGSKLSMGTSKNISLTATAIGIRMVSKTSGRHIVIPYSNVKGFELFPDEESD